MPPEKTMDFKPIEFNGTELPPEAKVGEYEAKVDSVKVTATSKDQYPMLILEWKLTATADSDNEESIGSLVTDFVTFMPPDSRGGRMAVQRYIGLVDALGIDRDIVPAKLESKLDFRELIDALKGKEATVWVTSRKDKATGEDRTGVQYTAPRGSLSPMKGPGDDDDEEAEEARPTRGSKAAPAKKGAKNSRRN